MAAAKRRKPTVMTVEEPDDDFPSMDEADETPLVDNAFDAPLFANSDRRSLRSVAFLRVFKFEGGGMVYRGQVPLNTSLEELGEQFGDGKYNIEACNVKHRVLDRAENIRIAIGARGSESHGGISPFSNAAELERVERLSAGAANQAIEQSRTFTTMVTEHSQTAAQRERDFMTSMMAQQQAGFTQMMALLQTSHSHTLQRLEAMTANSGQNQIDPVQLMQLMMTAIRTGADMTGGAGAESEGEQPAWLQILGGGADLLLNTARRTFANPNPNAAPANSNTPAAAGPKRMTAAQKALVKDALQLSSAIAASGLTVPEALERLKSPAVTPSAPERPVAADTDNDDDEDDNVFVEEDDEDDESESDDNESEEPDRTGEPDSASHSG